jgi:uncharacterized protein involved in cysteine biosynthesis
MRLDSIIIIMPIKIGVLPHNDIKNVVHNLKPYYHRWLFWLRLMPSVLCTVFLWRVTAYLPSQHNNIIITKYKNEESIGIGQHYAHHVALSHQQQPLMSWHM